MKMNHFKRQLLSSEFPFLGNPGVWKCPECQKLFETWQSDCQSDSAWCPFCKKYIHKKFEVTTKRSTYTFLSADEISVKRTDDELLSSTPWVKSYSWSGGGYCHFRKAYAIAASNVIELECSQDDSDGSGGSYTYEADTISNQLASLNIFPEFIVIDRFRDHDANGRGGTSREVTIFKNRGGHEQYRSMANSLRSAYDEVFAEISNGEQPDLVCVRFNNNTEYMRAVEAMKVVRAGGELCGCLEDGEVFRVIWNGSEFVFTSASFI